MGTILSRLLELEPKLKEIGGLVRFIDERGREANYDMNGVIYRSFERLRPLSQKFKVVCRIDKYSELGIGSWLREKHSYHRFGTVIESKETFKRMIRRFGDQLTPHTRRDIRGIFRWLVEQTQSLMDYSEMEVVREVKPQRVAQIFSLDGRVELRWIEVKGLRYSVINPREITLLGRWLDIDIDIGDPSIRLDGSSNIAIVEDLADDIIAVLREAKALVEKANEHNEPILKDMDDTTAAYHVNRLLFLGD